MKGKRVNFQPAKKGDQSLNLGSREVFIRKMFAADENSAIGESYGDRVVGFTLQQRLEGLEDKIVTPLYLRVGGRVQPHCSEGCVQSDRKFKKKAASFRGWGEERGGHDCSVITENLFEREPY